MGVCARVERRCSEPFGLGPGLMGMKMDGTWVWDLLGGENWGPWGLGLMLVRAWVCGIWKWVLEEMGKWAWVRMVGGMGT